VNEAFLIFTMAPKSTSTTTSERVGTTAKGPPDQKSRRRSAVDPAAGDSLGGASVSSRRQGRQATVQHGHADAAAADGSLHRAGKYRLDQEASDNPGGIGHVYARLSRSRTFAAP
jgi:hypothetical protein